LFSEIAVLHQTVTSSASQPQVITQLEGNRKSTINNIHNLNTTMKPFIGYNEVPNPADRRVYTPGTDGLAPLCMPQVTPDVIRSNHYNIVRKPLRGEPKGPKLIESRPRKCHQYRGSEVLINHAFRILHRCHARHNDLPFKRRRNPINRCIRCAE